MQIPIPTINYDDLYKFVSSCGFFFVIVSTLSFGLEVEFLLFPLWLKISLLVLGVATMVFGLWGWSKRQKNIDKKLGLEIKNLEESLKPATDSEKKQNIQKMIVTDSTDGVKSQSINDEPNANKEYVNDINKLLNKLSSINNPNYKVLIEQKLSDKFIYDAVLVSKTWDKSDKVIEIKYIRKFMPSYYYDMVLSDLTRMLSEYNKNVSRNATAILILLLDGGATEKMGKIRQDILKRALDIPELSGLHIEIIKAADIDNYDANILCI